MTYIINPAWFYWLNVANTLKIVIAVAVGIVCFIFLGIFLTSWLDGFYDEDEERKIKNLLKRLGISLAVMVVALIFIPSRQTLMEMMIAKQLTVQNVEVGIDAIKSAVDYIVQAIAEVK